MTVFDVMKLICGLALFLFGMEIMSDSLKKTAGNNLKCTLEKMTAGKWRGIMLGAGITALIQSCSATTVMVVGFVNSGTMTLSQSVSVIIGSNVGAGITAWITGLSGIGSVTTALQWLQPMSWVPLLALFGIVLLMFSKREKYHNIGTVLLGFSVLMVGMDTMSEAVGGLKTSETFRDILVQFENPILGLLAGMIVTAIIQSSGASVGILQSLTATGAISFKTAIPIVLGQNIGTCITALLSSVGATKNGKRAAFIHLYYNVVGAVIFLGLYLLSDAVFDFAFLEESIGAFGVALVHTVFKLFCLLLLTPMSNLLVKLAEWTIKGTDKVEADLLDIRLLKTPAVAVQRALEVACDMEKKAVDAMLQSLPLLFQYEEKTGESIANLEEQVDVYEDSLGTYLVQINSKELSDADSREVTKLLHLIGDFERISDHAVNLVESAEEIRSKNVIFSESAYREVQVLTSALEEILLLVKEGFETGNLDPLVNVEPLEQRIDDLCDIIKSNHIARLQTNECTIEHGFVLADILTNCERVSDHCSNIAGLIIEMAKYDTMNMHRYLAGIKSGEEHFEKLYQAYTEKYKV